MQRKFIYFIDGFLTVCQLSTCYELSIQYIPNPAFSNKLLLTACKIRASNCKILLLRSSSFQNSKLTFYLVIKVEFEDCSLQQLHISSSVHHSMILFRILGLRHAVKEPSGIQRSWIQRRSSLRGVAGLTTLHPRQQSIKFSLRQCSKGT